MENGKLQGNLASLWRSRHLRLHILRASYYEVVEEVIESIARSLLELDGQYSRILEQLFSINSDDVRRALWDSSNRKAVILSIGRSWRLTNNRCCWKLTVIILDGGGVRSYSSILVIKALMDHVRSAVKDTKMKALAGMHVHLPGIPHKRLL